jgi:hypothetical protein
MGEASFLQKQSAVVRITALDSEHYRVAWCTLGYPKFILDTERWLSSHARIFTQHIDENAVVYSSRNM